ncbi:MAG: DnaD domain protein [Chloroflexota bacterium]|nr:DnaD domain protein [Chloroflexota bacterium]
MTFAGFPARPQSTAIPNVFFADVLPRLGEPGTLAVALFAFHLLARKKGFPRYVTRAEFAAEPSLAAYLAASGEPAALIDAGLRRAVDAGVLLRLAIEREGGRDEWYFLNAPADRRGLDAVRRGDVPVARVVDAPAAAGRASIYALYESLIGTLGPGMAEALAEAERLYPADWIEAAFHEAAQQNARSWRYITRILERWATEGRDHAQTDRDPAAGDRYFAGKYGRILKQRLGR